MATYNRPGVYLEEVPSSVALSSTPTSTVATFMGALSKGPLDATLVSSWGQFTALYGDIAANSADPDTATAVYLFFANGGSQCFIDRVVVTVAAVSNAATTASTTLTIVAASGLTNSEGATTATITSANAVGATITGNGIPSGTVITAVSTTTLTLSKPATVPTLTPLTVTTPTAATVAIKGNTTVAVTNSLTPAQSGTTLTFTSAAHSLKVGQTVKIEGVLATTATPTTVYQGTFVVTAVPTSTTFSVVNPNIATAVAITTGGTVTAQSATTELTLTAKSPGVWSNGLYYEIGTSSASTSYPGKYFNLTIYSGGTNSSYIVERFTDLTLLATDPSYAPTVINASSNYVIATDSNATNHTAVNFANTNTPLTTNLTAVTAVGGNAAVSGATITLTGTIPAISIGMNVIGNGITSGTTVTGFTSPTVTLSAAMAVPTATSLIFTNAAVTGGSDGTAVGNTTVASASSTSKLDAISQPLLLNAPGVTEAANVNALLTYAYNRGDVFVIIDPTQVTLDVSSQLTLANSYTGGVAGAAALGYGAVYYPNLTIPNPTSSAQGSIATAYPGGAIAAKYATTDSSRGVFKSPAGLEARLSGVVAVTSLTNNELDALNNGAFNSTAFTFTPVNAIRYIPGSGIVVMGARTLSSTYTNRYISVRRSLIYLRKTLSDSTAFALFESNDERLWNRLQTTCESILINFWQSGGLKGATALDAFYVKVDSSINTVSSVAAGEVHLEIGVALQRPAEFVVIRISQYDSGSVVTVL